MEAEEAEKKLSSRYSTLADSRFVVEQQRKLFVGVVEKISV